jgi:hypothetical protein
LPQILDAVAAAGLEIVALQPWLESLQESAAGSTT